MDTILIDGSGLEWYTPRGLVIPWGAEQYLKPDELFVLIRLINLVRPIPVEVTTDALVAAIGMPPVVVQDAIREIHKLALIDADWGATGLFPCFIRFRTARRLRRFTWDHRRVGDYLNQRFRKKSPILSPLSGYTPKNRGVWTKRWLYFMRSEDTGWVKIGQSNHPEYRKSNIERDLGESLVILATMSNESRLEYDLHQKFIAHRVKHPKQKIKKEWFILSDEIQLYINEHLGRPDIDPN